MFKTTLPLVAACLLLTAAAAQQPSAPCSPAQADSSFIDSSGTAHVTRVVPVPATLSPEAQKWLAQPVPDTLEPYDLAADRDRAAGWQARGGELMRTVYPVQIASQTIAGVPTRIVTPLAIPAGTKDRVLLNLHGGGFTADWGSMIESIPIANLTQTKVVAVLYRLAPEHPFPAAVDDAVAVYRELLKTYKPQTIGVYGTSAGAILTGERAVKLRQLGLPLPAALGIFSGGVDFSRQGDSMAIYGLQGFSGPISRWSGKRDTTYTGTANPKDPVLSPAYADLKGMPPTLFLTSGRDLLLSDTVNLHRSFVLAGNDARLLIWDALPHAFWNNWELPESKEAYGVISSFFDRQLGK